ncbi:ABC transporter G family member 45-like isoform X4 [Iris pallida]|uniref:ABC transporter G family member 45-like isoform X4 n=1 Tax=Iris pallida TaxID=29817 RepID=A0AAX6IDT5_IRIPA|nr:ABC transporter G family member 45-like isoform X4 [Iris pallida]
MEPPEELEHDSEKVATGRTDQGSRLTHADNEEFLRRLRDRKMSLGIEDPKVEVRFEDLTVEADMHVGRRALPTLPNTVINTMQDFLGCFHSFSSKKRPIKLLDGVKGIVKPSRLTLILGPPGSGKSTLLRVLSGKLDPTLKVTGKVMCNGQQLSPSTPQCMCVYVSQYDLHHAEMTVRETLDFSGRIFGTENAFRVPGRTIDKKTVIDKLEPEVDASFEGTCEEGTNITTNYVLKLLRLYECADITIGDQMRRGISGGQKKRVTIGEMLVSLARCFFMDDISTGLDSSTTFEIVKFLSQMAHLMDLTMVISLLQPPPETFELFDDIIVLCEGKIAYQGPREQVLDFFEHMGFKCPDRKNIADFLQEVTSKMDQAQYWTGNHREYQYLSVENFAESFCSYHLGQLLEGEMTKLPEAPIVQLNITDRISKWDVFKACFSREILLFKRNSPVHIFKTVQIVLLAFVIMTLFLRTEMNYRSIADGNKFMGAIFAGVVILKFNGMTELHMIISRLPTFYKQRELLLLPGWALLSSVFILSLPVSLIETGIWTCLTYFVIGFAPSAIRFFQQFLALFCVHQMSMGLFRFIAAVGRTKVMAATLGSGALVAIYILGGFIVSKDNLQPWLVWGYWASPLTYGQNAVALNEFLDGRWSMKTHYKGINADTLGKAVLRSRGLFTEWHWYWVCVGILLIFSVLFNILSVFALEYLNAPYTHTANGDTEADIIRTTRKAKSQGTQETPPQGEMVLPFQPLTVVFQHINYYVDMPMGMKKLGIKEKRLKLLHDVSGAFRPRVLTALMGVTGAGKTTLLDVLAGKKTEGYIEGTITICGHPKKQETFARICGYCEQTDVHSPFLTVFESLQFSAWLRLPSHIDTQKREMFVEEVMGLIELLPLKNSMVGLPGVYGLSAEQRKRLTIAVELVSSPSIIFMDEPTTGLDARAAAIVMRTVRKTVDTGRTVVCTIHQPSTEIFESFDELLLMEKGGQLIYSGPLGPLSCSMIQYFEAVPGCLKIKNGQNPAAWVLDITSTTMEHNLCLDYADIFRTSNLYRESMGLVEELSKISDQDDLYFPSRYEQNFKSQYAACLWKQHKSYWKNPEHNVVRFITTIMVSLLFGLVFWQLGSKITRQQDIFNILGAMYGSALFLGFLNATLVQPVVETERTVFYRERSAGMYSSVPYAIAQVTIEIPYIVVQVIAFSVIVYPMIGFQVEVAKFLWFILFMLFSFIYFTVFGMMTVALTPSQEIAAVLSFLIYVLWNIFSGFIIPRKMIPVWWRWFYWADPAAWTVYGLMFSQLGDHDELIHVPGRSDQTVKEFIEDYLGLQDHYFALIVALHIVVIVLFSLLFVFSIKNLNFQKK